MSKETAPDPDLENTQTDGAADEAETAESDAVEPATAEAAASTCSEEAGTPEHDGLADENTSAGDDRESGDAAATDSPGAEQQESQQRRREIRDFEVSGEVSISGQSFPLKNWSSSGFGIDSCDLEFEDHARVPIDFTVTHSSGTLSFSCKAVIVRSCTASCEVAGAFVEMAREDRVAVAAYFDAMDES